METEVKANKNLSIILLIIILMLSLAGCGYEYAVTVAPDANDVGEKADVLLPELSKAPRDESGGYLAIITGVSDGKTEKGYYDSALEDYLNGKKGNLCYLYGSGKEIEPVYPEGISFDQSENKVVLDGFQGKDVILLAEKMGSDLILEVKRNSLLNSVQIISGGLQIEGDGKLTVESTTRDSGLYIDSPDEYAYLIIKDNVSLDVSSTTSWLISVTSIKDGKNFYYLDPLKMSDGKKRIKTPEVAVGAIWYVENTGEKYYAPQSSPEDPLIVLYKMDHVTISAGH